MGGTIDKVLCIARPKWNAMQAGSQALYVYNGSHIYQPNIRSLSATSVKVLLTLEYFFRLTKFLHLFETHCAFLN